MEELWEARLVENFGFEGCSHARADSKRQVLLLDWETLEAMSLGAGMVRENITTEGLAVSRLSAGERVKIGAAELEVTGVCTPCDLLEKIRPGLRREIWGRRGMLCRVVAGGVVQKGYPIEKLK